MTPDRRTIAIDAEEDRYSRLRMLPWWNQELLARSKVLVVGAGALGNEIIKNLALLGIGEMLIVDFDTVEESNLSRSVLYRAEDEGKPKCQAAASAARAINPECRIHSMHADIIRAVGLGVFRWADVVICGLDNREARLAVNKACWRVNRPWVDGATEALQGIARAFVPPDGVCYECTLGEQDQRIMAVRNSCGFFAREAYKQGHTPTTPTTSAVIAGIEVQEAIKLLHGQAGPQSLVSKGFFFDGVTYECFTIDYSRRDDCLSHETYDNIVESDLTSSATLSDVMRLAESRIGKGVVVDLRSEIVTALNCTRCGTRQTLNRLLQAVSIDEVRCPECGSERVPDVAAECEPRCDFNSVPLVELGFGIMDIVSVRAGERSVQIEISGDAAAVFGS